MQNRDLFEIEKRGGCLTNLLIILFIALPLGGFINLFSANMLSDIEKFPVWSYYIMAVFSFINLGIAIYIWNWKKAGIYLLWISSILSMLFDLYIGNSVFASISCLIMPLIITLLFSPKWKHFN